MKVFSLFLVMTAGLFAQAAAPQDRPAPGSTATSPGATTTVPQTPPTVMGTPPAPVSPDTVVAKVGDKSYTAAEMDKLLSDLPPQLQATIARQPQLLTNMFMFKTLAQQAEFQNLDKEPATHQQLEYQRMSTLAQAEVNHYKNSIKITGEDQKNYYDQNRDQYRIARVKAIKIAFAQPSPVPAVKPPSLDPKTNSTRTEAEAQAKIDDIRKQIAAGADFSKLATEQSDDKTSAAKGGDYGDITMTSGSEKERIAVFKLKPGGVSEPVKEPGAFYLFRLEEMTVEPFDKVEARILQQMQQGEFKAWISGVEAHNKVTIENPGWFATRNAR